jgi:CRP/FNR family cyclic AMP-dependent transcriptional regulator
MAAPNDTFLSRLPVFAGVDAAALALLAQLTHERDYAAGEVIVREGEPGDRMYFVRRGRVRVVKAPAVTLAEFGPGDFFGEMSLVESVVRSADVMALEPTQVCTLRGRDFYELYRKRPDQYGVVILNIARDLARRLRRLDENFCNLSH